MYIILRRSQQASNLMIKAARKFKRATDSKHITSIAINLFAENFSAYKPKHKWVGDITYLATSKGWLYTLL